MECSLSSTLFICHRRTQNKREKLLKSAAMFILLPRGDCHYLHKRLMLGQVPGFALADNSFSKWTYESSDRSLLI
jgi:hypothetical protein